MTITPIALKRVLNNILLTKIKNNFIKSSKMKNYFLFILYLIIFNSCTFLKSSEDHENFLRERLMQMYDQKGIYFPTITEENYLEYSSYKFVDNIKSKRTGNGTFLSKMNIYSIYFDYENCQIPYPGMPGYVYRDRYGTRIKSILKEPQGILEIRTAYDGNEIYVINSQIIGRSDEEDDKSKWVVIKQLRLPCR